MRKSIYKYWFYGEELIVGITFDAGKRNKKVWFLFCFPN